jgi:hypothetical protein
VDRVFRLFRASEQASASTTIRASWGKRVLNRDRR